MNTQKKIEIIYNKIADKELSFWCKVYYYAYDKGGELEIDWIATICKEYYKSWWWELTGDEEVGNLIYDPIEEEIWYYEYVRNHFEWYDKLIWKYAAKIIWHPVMIWDVLDHIENNNKLHSQKTKIVSKLFDMWGEKRRSIDEQDEECINYIYNLIKNND